ncbi:MAG: MaoC family dehydratase [Hyphomicrobiaceae bacterium]|nr:MaoC family dehydratase [Hyphomicrobiaceae bacterium]
MSTYFEDLEVGRVTELGSHTFNVADIKAFAAKYDPQPFHLDEEAAKRSLFGALAASGWHSAAVYTGMNIRARQAREAEARARGEEVARWGPSPGFKDLRWPRPVLAGDTVTFRQIIAELTDFKNRPERGMLVTRGEGYNQNGELVFQVTGQILVPRRVPLGGAAKP